MRKNRTRNFMSTQTGGEGETIQAQPDAIQSEEQFDKNLPPVQQEQMPTDQAPIVKPEDATPIVDSGQQPPVGAESVKTDEEIDINTGNATDAEKLPVTETPIWPPQTQAEQYVNEITPEQSPIEEIKYNPNSDPTKILNDDGSFEDISAPTYETTSGVLSVPELNFSGESFELRAPIKETPTFLSKEDKDAYEKEQELKEFSPSTIKYFEEYDKKEEQKAIQINNNNSILSGKAPVYTSYDNILSSSKSPSYVIPNTEDERQYDDPKFGPSANMQTFMDVVGMNQNAIETLVAETGIENQDNVAALYARDLQNRVKYGDRVKAMEESLKSGVAKEDITDLNGIVVVAKGQKIPSDKKQQINNMVKFDKTAISNIDTRVKNFDYDVKIDKSSYDLTDNNQSVDFYDKFEKQTNNKLKKFYGTTWQKIEDEEGGVWYQIPSFKSFEKYTNGSFDKDDLNSYAIKSNDWQSIRGLKNYAKWLDTEGRKYIQYDIKNGTQTFFSKEAEKFKKGENVGAFREFNDFYDNQSLWVQEMRNDIYEIEAHKYYQQTGKVDNFTYSGFNATSKRLAKENQKSINDGVTEVANNVFENINDQEKEWTTANKKLLMKQIDGVKKQMDAALKNNLEYAISKNDQAKTVYDDFSNKIIVAKTAEEKEALTKQMMVELRKFPAISNTIAQYDESLNRFVAKAQADYATAYSSFKDEIVTSAKKDLQAGVTAKIREIYRSGVNNDLNTYEFANSIVNTKEFKDASFYGKRKIISDAWDAESARITAMVKSGVLRFPKTKEETGKHWTQWTGSRPMTAQEKSKWNSELAKRTGSDARSRFIFYAVDDLLYNPKGKPSVYAIQAFAREQLSEIEAKEKAFGIGKDWQSEYSDIIGGFTSGPGSKKWPLSKEEAKQMLLTKKYLTKIINTPETDQGTWSEFTSGLVDGFEIPFLGAIMGIANKNTLNDAVGRYQTSSMDTYDLSLVNAYGALNKLQQIKPNSFAYNVGSGLGFTATFMLEMMATGGFNSIGRGMGVKVAEGILSVGKSSTDDIVRASVDAAAQTPAYVDRVKNIVGFMAGGITEGLANVPQWYNASIQRMIDNVSVQESGAYDNLIAIVDRNSGEGTFEAFAKGTANWVGMSLIERLGGHLPTSKLTQEAAQYMGTSTFMKRTFVGKLMRDYGFKSVDEASEFLASSKMPWSGFLPEMMEEVLQGGWEAFITGDSPVFGLDDQGKMNYMGMTSDELKTTAFVVGIFGSVMNVGRRVRINSSEDNNLVSIQTENEDGTVQAVNISKDTWENYNSLISDPNYTWKSVSQFMANDDKLSAEAQAALANVFVKMRGQEILEDEEYKNWKEGNTQVVETNKEIQNVIDETKQKAYDALSEEDKKKLAESEAAKNYQYMTVGGLETGKDLNSIYNLIKQNEDKMSGADMTIVETDKDGKKTETTAEEKSKDLAERKKKRAKELTSRGGRSVKQVTKQREKQAEKEQEAPAETPAVEPTQEGIQFEMPKATTETATPEVQATESTITTPIDLTDDTENKPGVSGEVGKEQEPVQAQPVAEAGQEAVSPSGVVQEEQKVEATIKQIPFLPSSVNDTPILGGEYFIPRSVYEQAYQNDEANKGYQSLDSIIARGGYSIKEMDKLLPDWKQKVVEFNSTKTEAAPVQAAPAETEIKSSTILDENGSFTDGYAEEIIDKILAAFGPRQASMVAKGLRKAGFTIPYAYENSGTSISQTLVDSPNVIKSEYTVSNTEEKSQATKELTKLAKSLGIEVELETKEVTPTQTVPEAAPAAVESTKTVAQIEDDIEALNERINEIYDNGEEDTKEGKAELDILNTRIKALETERNQAPVETEEVVQEDIPVAEEEAPVVEEVTPVAEEEVLTEEDKAAQSFKDRYLNLYNAIPESNKKRRRSMRDYISNQQSSIDANDRKGAALALAEIDQVEKEAKQPAKTSRAKTTKEEAPKVKTDADGFVSYESSIRGVQNKAEYDEKGKLKPKGFFSAKISEDGSKVTVKDATGKVAVSNAKILTNENDGSRYVVANGNMLNLDSPVYSSQVSTEEAKAETKTKASEYKKRVPGFYLPGKKTANVGMSPTEINQLKKEAETLKKDPNYGNNKKSINRVKEIEDIINSNKGKVSPKAAELAEELAYDPKSEDFSGTPGQAGISDPLGKPYTKAINNAYDKGQITQEEYKALDDFLEQKKKEYYDNKSKSQGEKERQRVENEAAKKINELANSPEATEEDKEALQDSSAQTAMEVVLTDTADKKKRKPRNKSSLSATRARGATMGLPIELLSRLQKAFPNYITGVDTRQAAFQAAARRTGRSRNSAAIIDNGVIYLNDRVANANTALEEFSHLYLLVMQANNPALYKKGIATVQKEGRPYIDEVMNDRGYAYIHNNENWDQLSQNQKDKVAFEAVSKMIADRGEIIFEQQQKSPIVSWIKEFWRNLTRIVFGFSRKIDVMRDDINTYTDIIARELLKGRPISEITPERMGDVMEILDKGGDLGYVPLSESSYMNFKSGWIGAARRVFAANKGVGEELGMKLKSPARKVAALDSQAKNVVIELNGAIYRYGKAKKKAGSPMTPGEIKLNVDKALKDPEFRANLFASDTEAREILKPTVMKMRDMVDSLSKQLVDSGNFGDALVASINANNDVYLHTSYFIFSKAAETNKENWINYYSEADKQEIFDWISQGAFSKAVSMNYNIDPRTGKVKISFNNSFGERTTEDVVLDDLNALNEYLKANVKTVVGHIPASIAGLSITGNEGVLDLGNAMNIDNTGLKYVASENALTAAVNDLVGSPDRTKLTDFLNLQQQIVTSTETSITKKKQKRMEEAKKKLLMEINDPAYNFANTISKQASLLYKSDLEKQILDAGYFAFDSNPDSASQNKVRLGKSLSNYRQVTNPNSNLYGKYIPTEMFDMLYGTDMLAVKQNGIWKFAAAMSAYTKMALTVFSAAANSANYVSGWLQLAKTGGMSLNLLNIGHRTATAAVNQQMDLKSNISSAAINTVATSVRGVTTAFSKLFGDKSLDERSVELTENQKAEFGVTTYDQLNSKQKAQILSQELVEQGIIGTGLEAETLKALSEFAFDNVEIPEDAIANQLSKFGKVRRGAKTFGRKAVKFRNKTIQSFANTYQYTDSMFKAMMYLDHKDFNMKTYGAELKLNGLTDQEIEQEIRNKTAIQVRMQMPTYDRSPEFLRLFSRFPILGPFVQFDFQNKVNDKNILMDGAKMMFVDAKRMADKGLNKEASQVFMKGAYKTGMAVGSQFLTAVIYGVFAKMYGWDDDDDEAMRRTQPNYRRYNGLIHIDSNKTGIHEYIDVNRVMPQALYYKYWRAFKEDGAVEAVKQFFEPYINQDVFTGAVFDTFSGINKFGQQDETLSNMGLLDKLDYMFSERLLPSTIYGQYEKIIDAMNGEESAEGIPADVQNELLNLLTGVKVRSVRLDKTFGQRIGYSDYKELKLMSADLKAAIKARDKRIEQAGRGVEAATPEDIKKLTDEATEEYLTYKENFDAKMEELYNLADSYRKLGFDDATLYQAMIKYKTPQYLAKAILYRIPVNFNEVTGERIDYGKGKGAMDMDMDMDMKMDMDMDMNMGM